MKVVDGLSGVEPLVDHHSVSAVEMEHLRNLSRSIEKELVVARIGNRRDSRDLRPRHDQQVNGSLRIDVFERDAMLVLIDDFGGNFPIDDLREKRRHG